jgi:hypothetical protein
MPIDPTCQPIAASLAELESERDAARATLDRLAPTERWQAFATIGECDRKLAEGQRQLDECQRRQVARYDAELAVFDTSGGSPGSRSATLWRMGDGEPAVLETAPIDEGAFSFAAPPADATLGLTIQETGDPAVTGLDFRSGPLHELPRTAPSDPSARVELVSTPIIALGEEDVARLLGSLALPLRTSTPLAAPIGSFDVEVSALAASLLVGEIHLHATGTATAGGGAGGAVSAPFSLELPLAVALPVTPDLDHTIELRRTGSPTLTASGALGALLTPLAPLVGGFVADAALPGLRRAIDDAVPRAVAATFGLVDLPPGSVVSLRRVEVAPQALTIAAALGAFGNVLSTFEP